MSCNCCGQPEKLCRCPKHKGAPQVPKRACIKECNDCDPCKPCESMVKICSFVVPTLTEGQVFRNSFVYNQEDDAVYYITDDGTPIRFGASPMFIDYFDPASQTPNRQIVFDFGNKKAYVYNPEGQYVELSLGGVGETVRNISVTYDAGGWGPVESIGPSIDYNPATLSGRFIGTRVVPNPVFTDDTTGETVAIKDVYDALVGGERIKFNHVPVGWYTDRTVDPTVIPSVDGVELTIKQLPGGDSTNPVFSGTAFVWDETTNVAASFGATLLKYVDGQSETHYKLYAQGVLNAVEPN